jgi:hypothetical protein
VAGLRPQHIIADAIMTKDDQTYLPLKAIRAGVGGKRRFRDHR